MVRSALASMAVSAVVASHWRVPHPLGDDKWKARLTSCQLGAGYSLCAIRGGRSLATTMGLVMSTRSGQVDDGLLLHQLQRGIAPDRLYQDLNYFSGLLGI
jgi:acetate kinase